ncbi:MAG: chitobiase/beta-hexosaminidase C-terminal domain-containing protein [Candidatus Korobacteraceae bacterium]
MARVIHCFGCVRQTSLWSCRVAIAAAMLLLLSPWMLAQVQVLTEHNDNARQGRNTQETILTPELLTSGQFGRIISYPVDGYIYGQPLYVPNVTIPGQGVHNVVYVVTEHDSVYAFDADGHAAGGQTPLWSTSFINPLQGITTVSINDVNCDDGVIPEIGITSTPVIDPTTDTIYVIAETKENGEFFQRLHALDITTGAEKNGSPVTITATYPGTGDGSSGGILTFNPLMELNRPGLLHSNGNIYITWASNCDNSPFHGWIISYQKTSLRQTGVWVTTPNGGLGGVWMGGAGIATDAAGNLYVATGNGTFETSGDPTDFGDSVLKLSLTSQGIQLLDYFTPYNESNLENGDEDVGSGGVLVLPDQPGAHPHELVQSGKEGSIYVVDRDNMGHFNPNNNSQIVQNLTGEIEGIYGAPAYWNNNVYFAGRSDSLKAFNLSNGLLSSQPTSQSSVSFGFPSPTPSISSHGNSGGIVWLLQTDAYRNDGNDILYAFDATNVGNMIYSSVNDQLRDNPGGAVKFAVPTIANGKVYVGAAGQLSVYGVVPPAASTPVFTPPTGTYTTTVIPVTISESTPGAVVYYTTDGSTPTTNSPVYSVPILLTSTTTIKAIAVASGYSNSNLAAATYTLTTGGGGFLNYANGFTPMNIVLNGTADFDGSRLRLTHGGTGENASAWYATPVNVQAFHQDFSFQLTNPIGDGMTFVIQGVGTAAIGPGGAGLGYGATSPGGNGGMPNSVAIKFDLYNDFGEGIDSTGLYTDGASPTIPANDMTSSGVNLHSGHVFNVHMIYDGTTLQMHVTDTVTSQQYGISWTIDIPGTVGTAMAYIGFTGSSRSVTATQEILSWTFASQGAINYGSGFAHNGLALNGNAGLHGSRLRLTHSGNGEVASAWYLNRLNIQSFAQQFSFQITNPVADGMTFTIQNSSSGTSVVGPGGGGLGYGATSPGGSGGIPASVAVKFDLYNNDGEGIDSTGLYVNGASPTVPAIDMTSSGVNLHSGDIFDVWMTYDGTTLTMQITDTMTQATFTASWTIDIPSTIGGNTAYVGFTGATGGSSSTQEILNWIFTSQGAVEYGSGFTAGNLALNDSASINGSRLRLTDGGIGEKATAWYDNRVNIESFTQEFSFQLTNPQADGITFAIQNVNPRAQGPGGGGLAYGAFTPNGSNGIPNSIAVKFDIHNNFGEGVDSTGLYTDGDSPTIPAIDLTSSGVNLHSGDVFNVRMTYDGTTLSMRIADATTQATFQTSWPVNIPQTVGANTAYVGFTGATGSTTATQDILSWIYIP